MDKTIHLFVFVPLRASREPPGQIRGSTLPSAGFGRRSVCYLAPCLYVFPNDAHRIRAYACSALHRIFLTPQPPSLEGKGECAAGTSRRSEDISTLYRHTPLPFEGLSQGPGVRKTAFTLAPDTRV